MSGCNVCPSELNRRRRSCVSSRERYDKILTRTLIIISSLLRAEGPLRPTHPLTPAGGVSQLTLAPANWQTYPSYVSHVPAATYERQRPSRITTTTPFTTYSPPRSPPLPIYINSSSYFRSFNPLGSACERATRMEHASSTEPSPSTGCNAL